MSATTLSALLYDACAHILGHPYWSVHAWRTFALPLKSWNALLSSWLYLLRLFVFGCLGVSSWNPLLSFTSLKDPHTTTNSIRPMMKFPWLLSSFAGIQSCLDAFVHVLGFFLSFLTQLSDKLPSLCMLYLLFMTPTCLGCQTSFVTLSGLDLPASSLIVDSFDQVAGVTDTTSRVLSLAHHTQLVHSALDLGRTDEDWLISGCLPHLNHLHLMNVFTSIEIDTDNCSLSPSDGVSGPAPSSASTHTSLLNVRAFAADEPTPLPQPAEGSDLDITDRVHFDLQMVDSPELSLSLRAMIAGDEEPCQAIRPPPPLSPGSHQRSHDPRVSSPSEDPQDG